MGQAVQGCTPADADDVAVLDDFIDIGCAALADIFLDFFFIFDGGVGDADLAQPVDRSHFLGQLALVFDGVEDFDAHETHVLGVLQEPGNGRSGQLQFLGDIGLAKAGLVI